MATTRTKEAEALFAGWIAWQKVIKPMPIALSSQEISKKLKSLWKTHKTSHLIHAFPEVFKALTGTPKPTSTEYATHASQHLEELYEHTQTDMPTAIKKLKKLGLCKKNKVSTVFQKEIDTYIAFSTFLYGQRGNTEDNPQLFCIANQIAHYLLAPETFPEIKRLFGRKANYPLLKLLLATTWHNLVSTGWKTWSSACLASLKKAEKQGKRVVYLAGGSDIYQLITNGIYNITVIDPQLPTQTDYYAEGWEWIIKGKTKDGGIGDAITFMEHDLVMTRTAYHEEPSMFTAQVATKNKSTKKVMLHPSKTTWTITNTLGKELGTCVFDRRFITQQDFEPNPKNTLLISFNEMFFISVPDELDGWGIDPHNMPENTHIIVKQLHEVITKEMLCNLRTLSVFNYKKMEFLNLGCAVL